MLAVAVASQQLASRQRLRVWGSSKQDCPAFQLGMSIPHECWKGSLLGERRPGPTSQSWTKGPTGQPLDRGPPSLGPTGRLPRWRPTHDTPCAWSNAWASPPSGAPSKNPRAFCQVTPGIGAFQAFPGRPRLGL